MMDVPTIRQPGPEGQKARAKAIASAGDLQTALDRGLLPKCLSVSLSEGLVLGLLKQGVRKYLAIFGHGSTDLAEVLRVYTEAGVTQVYNFRNEVEMAHAGTALAWVLRRDLCRGHLDRAGCAAGAGRLVGRGQQRRGAVSPVR